MASFLEAVGDGVRAVTCGVLGDAQVSIEWMSEKTGEPQVGTETIRSLRRWVCNNTDETVDLPEAVLTGGQCEGVPYQLNVDSSIPWVGCCPGPFCDEDGTDEDSVVLGNTSNMFYGPISVEGPFYITDASCGGFAVARHRIHYFDQNGNPETWNQDSTTGSTGKSGQSLSFSITATRRDGGTECGEPDPPPVPPYTPVTVTRDITFIDNSETEITEEGDFTLNAPIVIGGNIIAPVTVDVGGVEIPVDFNLSTGDITFDFGGDDDVAPTNDDDEEDVPKPDDEPDVEEELLIYGLIVYSTPATEEGSVTSEIAQGDAPLLLLPRTGNVWFQIPVGDRVTWAGPIPVQSQNQLVRVPDGMAASGYRLVPNTGWQLSEVRMGKPPCGCVSG